MNSTIFRMPKRILKTLLLQRFGFLQNCTVQVAHHVRVGYAELKDEDLAAYAIGASKSSFLHTMH